MIPKKRQHRPAVESLESRNLLSGLPATEPVGHAVAIAMVVEPNTTQPFHGTIHGHAIYHPRKPPTFELSGRLLVSGKEEQVRIVGEPYSELRPRMIVYPSNGGSIYASLSLVNAGFDYSIYLATGPHAGAHGSGLLSTVTGHRVGDRAPVTARFD